MKNKTLTTCLSCALLSISSVQASTVLINDFSATAAGALSTDNVDGNWHGNLTPWSIATNTLTHAPSGPTYNGADEGIVGQMVVPTSTSSSSIEISFDYNVGTGNTLYVHFRGFDAAVVGTPAWSINAGAQNGNAWNNAGSPATANGTSYNLWDGDLLTVSGNANEGDVGEAVSLTGMGTYTATIDLSGYTVSDVADFEYVMLGFAANATTDNTSTVSNLVVTVPEPSSSALIGLGGLALLLRRRK